MLGREGKSLNNFSLRPRPEEPEGGAGPSTPVRLGGKKWWWGRGVDRGSLGGSHHKIIDKRKRGGGANCAADMRWRQVGTKGAIVDEMLCLRRKLGGMGRPGLSRLPPPTSHHAPPHPCSSSGGHDGGGGNSCKSTNASGRWKYKSKLNEKKK